jgi:hypothetical protein
MLGYTPTTASVQRTKPVYTHSAKGKQQGVLPSSTNNPN